MNKAPVFSMALSSGGVSVGIGRGEILRPISLDGTSSGSYRIFFEEDSRFDGAVVMGKRLAPRRIDMLLEVSVPEESERMRSVLISFLNPKDDCLLTVCRGGKTRTIRCSVEEAEFIQPTLYDMLRVRLRLFCAYPYFSDPDDTGVSGTKTLPLFAFPFVSYTGAGAAAGLVSVTNEIVVNNRGDTDAGFTASLSASGRVKNPYLSLCGSVIRIIDTMKEGDVFTVRTVPGDKFIQKNGVPCFCFDRTSVFFTLPRGKSTVCYGSEEGEEALSVTVVFNNSYLGI